MYVHRVVNLPSDLSRQTLRFAALYRQSLSGWRMVSLLPWWTLDFPLSMNTEYDGLESSELWYNGYLRCGRTCSTSRFFLA